MNRMLPFPPQASTPKATDGAYVYVVQFSTGLVKVGWSKNPTDRIMKLHRSAAPFDITATAYWISTEHAHYLDSESALIGIAKRLGGEPRCVEYFKSVDPKALLNAFGDLDTKDIGPAGPPTGDLTSEEAAVWARVRRDRLRGVVRT